MLNESKVLDYFLYLNTTIESDPRLATSIQLKAERTYKGLANEKSTLQEIMFVESLNYINGNSLAVWGMLKNEIKTISRGYTLNSLCKALIPEELCLALNNFTLDKLGTDNLYLGCLDNEAIKKNFIISRAMLLYSAGISLDAGHQRYNTLIKETTLMDTLKLLRYLNNLNSCVKQTDVKPFNVLIKPNKRVTTDTLSKLNNTVKLLTEEITYERNQFISG